MEVNDQLHSPAALLPVAISYETGWAPEPAWTLWRGEASFALAKTRTPAVAHRYTGWAVSESNKV
jgi:hypothetical protein